MITKPDYILLVMEKTMFNTIGRAQGWSDTPLTEAGERGIRELGLGLKRSWAFLLKRLFRVILDAPFKPWELFSRNSGLTGKNPFIVMTNGSASGVLVVLTVLMMAISSWGVLPRVFKVDDFHQLSLMELAGGIVEVDTTGWAGILSALVAGS